MTPDQIESLLKIRSEVLKKLRRSKRITKIQVAEQTGLSRNTINTLENGSAGWNVVSEIIYTTYIVSLP